MASYASGIAPARVTYRTRRFVVACLVASLCWLAASAASAETAEILVKPLSANTRGRVDLLDPSGASVLRLKGLSKPQAITLNADGSFFVADRATNEILLFADSESGLAAVQSWKLPESFPYLLAVFREPSGSLLLADGIAGFLRLNQDATTTRFPYPGEEKIFSTAAALSDGRYIINRPDASDANSSLNVFNPADGSWKTVQIEQPKGEEPFIPNALSASGNSVYIWRLGQAAVVEGTLAGEVLKPVRVFHAPATQLASAKPDGGIVAVSMEGTVTELSADDKTLASFQFYVQPTSLAFMPGRKLIALSYEHPATSSWPEIQDQILGQQERPFDWATFGVWIGAASAAALLWSIVALLFGASGPSAPAAAAPVARGTPRLRALVLPIALLTSAGGLWMAWRGQQILLSGEPRSVWLPWYMAGAILVALSVEAWRRLSPNQDEPENFTQMMRGPIPTCSWLFMLPTLSIAALAVYVYQMGIDRSYFGVRESAFCAGLVLVFAIVAVEAIQCRAELLRFVKREWLLFGFPLAVGGVTFFYKLLEVPYNCHFDFTLNSFFAAQLLRGRVDGGWDWGYVPGPAFGTLPEIIGLLVGGFTPLGYRVGNSIFNISGLFAAYLLGKTYRNSRVGFWAALALAGNIPFIHFGRLQSNGSSATIALWTLALFALALKHKRVSLWTLAGLASGFSFYQWPVARVGFTAVGAVYALILLRYPLTQLRQSRQLFTGLVTFLLMIAPLIIMWQEYPQRFMPRAGASISGVTWEGGWLRAAAEHPTLQLLYRSFAWLFNEGDRSSQGTIGPGFNAIEAVLFACGCVVLLIEGLSFNVLLGTFLLITFLVCGAFAVGPPWYTRLLPTAPVACMLLARAIEGLHNFSAGRRWLFRSLLPISGVAMIALSTFPNFQKYVAHETHAGNTRYLSHPMVAIARKIHAIGPEPTYVLLARGERLWILKDMSQFGVMLPYVHGFRIKEVYDLQDELQVPPGTSKGFIVQIKRKDIDLPIILQTYPGTPVETITDNMGEPVALLALVRR